MSTLYYVLAAHFAVVVIFLIVLLFICRRNRKQGKQIHPVAYILSILSFFFWEITYTIVIIKRIKQRRALIGNLQYQIEVLVLELDQVNEVMEEAKVEYGKKLLVAKEELRIEKKKFRDYKRKQKESGQ